MLENLQSAAPDLNDTQVRSVLGSFLFSGDDATKPARVLSGGEKTRLALATLVVSAANVLLLDEPTNNLDPASRVEVLNAIRSYAGAIVLVTHDEGAVTGAAARPGADPARRRRGPLERGVRRAGRAGVVPTARWEGGSRAEPASRPSAHRSRRCVAPAHDVVMTIASRRG